MWLATSKFPRNNMASISIFSDISTIASRILMVWEANFVFSFLNSHNLTSYRTHLSHPIYQTKSIKPNLYLGDQTKSTNPNLQYQIYKIKSSKQNVQNV